MSEENKNVPVAFQERNTGLPSIQDLNALKECVSIYIKSGFLPTSVKTPEQAIVIALKGRELGIPALQALSHIHVISGKPTMSAELMLSLIRERCPQAKVELVESTDKTCVIRASRPGHEATKFSFTEADATKAGLIAKGGVWNSHRPLMLRARCISGMARFLFPDIVAGASYTPEEAGAALDSRGNIVPEISKAEVINAAAVQIEGKLPEDLGDYVIPIGTAKGKYVKDVSPDVLAKVKKFLTENIGSVSPEGREFLSVLKKYLPDEPAGVTGEEPQKEVEHESRENQSS